MDANVKDAVNKIEELIEELPPVIAAHYRRSSSSR
jgi:hypothetical protein